MSLEKLKNKKIIFFGDSITDSNRDLILNIRWDLVL